MNPAAESRGAWPRLALAALLLFAATLSLDTHGNRFPFFYHRDEPDKVEQLRTRKWNFHHPMLMLGAASLARTVAGTPDRPEALVITGRWCSAAFAAAGVVCFALLGWRARGWGGFWTVGLLLMTHHQVFELAHYLKEDTALLLGVGMAFLAMHVYWKKPTALAAGLVGIGCGFSVSAKYLGAVLLVPALVLMIEARRARKAGGAHWGWFAAGLLVVISGVNFPLLMQIDVFTHSLGRETTMLAQGERAYTGGQVPFYEYLHIFLYNTNPVIWVLIVAELAALRRRGGDASEWTMAVFPFALMLLLSCSRKTNDRYFLPATACFHYLAALGALDLPGLLRGAWRERVRPWMMAGLAVVAGLPLLAIYIRAFSIDDRADMLAWIHAHIPASAVIAGESHVDLPTTDRPERLTVQPLIPQRVIEADYAAKLGPVPVALAGQGIDYLIVSESDYGKFNRRAAMTHLTPELRGKKAFYDALFRDYQPLWQRPRGACIYLHPGLQIFQLRGAAGATTGEGGGSTRE